MADAISSLTTVSNTQGYVMEVNTNDIHTVSATMFCTEQNWGIIFRKLASQLCHSTKHSFKSVKIPENGILQKTAIHSWFET